MRKTKNYIIPIIIIIIGITLFIIGLCTKIPSDQLTTYKALTLDGEYSYVEEYFGADFYNYAVAAPLIGGKIVASTISKTIYISFGLLLCVIRRIDNL